ncbi:MAG: hypothetical protein JWN15_1595, partial [Firmicutes bacterium]|nr:hypothetical protein [Bacillota bacterium]
IDGTHTVSGAYAGSDSHLASESGGAGGHGQSLAVSKRSVSVTVACDPDPVALGQTATCTVTVTDTTDPAQIPLGSVSWTTNGAGTFGSDSCTLDVHGQCTVTYTPTQAGTDAHTITVTVPGSDTYNGATGSDSLIVRAASLTGTVTTDAGDVVAGITLFLVDGNGQTRASTTTTETGAYSFTELPGGNYTVKVRSESNPLALAAVNVPGGSAATLDIVLPTTATLTLTANPAKIVGDGKKVSTLTAVLTADGLAVGGVDVLFRTTEGTLFEVDPKTDLDGSARAKLRAPLIQGVNEVVQEATIKVHDVQRGLFAFAKINITFAPASVDGVVMDNGDPRNPIAGAKVRIHKTFDDGATFDGEAVTDAEGRYSIIVPRGNTTYQVEITADVMVGGVKKQITTTQTATLGDLSGIGEAIPATKTVSGQLFAPDKQGGITGIDVTLISGQQVVGVLRRKSDGMVLPNPVVIAANGAFQVTDVPIGAYDVVFQVQAPDGQRLAGAVVPVSVESNGELTLGAALVDPFGTVTDAKTGQPIPDVRVDLRWANTPLNVGKGRKPDQRVLLPQLPDFKPNQNRVSQNTTNAGEYAFMVFPDGDYYVVATKGGYQPHESPVIHVGETIVKYDLTLQKQATPAPVPAGPGTPAVPAAPQPTKVRGTVVDAASGRPIGGASVAIHEDFDGDGVLDVDAMAHTAADGSYELVVPQRNRTYTAQVITALPVQGKARPFIATQRIFVPANADTAATATARNTIAGQIYVVAVGGGEATVLTPDQARTLQASLQTAHGTPVNQPVTISDTGYYQVDDLAAGTYRILFQSKATDGRLVPVAAVTVPINQDGQLSLQTTVIDPFATVRDGDTNAPIPDALVSLFWADTPLNRGNGRTPGTLVNLPEVTPFVAQNNVNPHLSNTAGRYGWLCLPNGDYYLIAKKDGYLPYDSRNDTRALTLESGSLLQNGILHVETVGCNYDLLLKPMKLVLDSHTRYVQGYPDGNFRPENPVTRAEVAAIFARLMKVDLSGVQPAVMADLPATNWASRHIATVMKAGLFTGYPDGSFGPDKPITRAELAAVIARFKGLQLGKRTVFQDTAGHWAEPYITATFEAGIVLGFTDNTFGPTLTTKRSELVAMVNRMLGRGQLMTGRTQPRWSDVPFSYWAVRHIEEASISHTSRLGEGQTETLVEEFADTIE